MLIAGETDYRRILKRELESRCQQNARYSLRAFARDLALPASRLSEVLNGKQGLSRERASGIATTLGFSASESDVFCDLVESQHARGRVNRELAKVRLEKNRINSSFHDLQLDAFQAVSDWYHFALIQLISLPEFKNDPAWISKALGISAVEARDAMERLERLKLIEVKRGKVTRLQEFVAVNEQTPSSAIRKFHRQVLERAMLALDNQPLEERSFSAIFVPIDKQRMVEAKRWIKNFRRRFCRKLDAGDANNSVYCLSVQFFNIKEAQK
ncbi:MAG: TIGR02147 family protein [Deltaproteobacteria bacterium]|nr:TIGR02147 family protein [Deltaproteobacteria bacterium]